jgi:hypothetical protein
VAPRGSHEHPQEAPKRHPELSFFVSFFSCPAPPP